MKSEHWSHHSYVQSFSYKQSFSCRFRYLSLHIVSPIRGEFETLVPEEKAELTQENQEPQKKTLPGNDDPVGRVIRDQPLVVPQTQADSSTTKSSKADSNKPGTTTEETIVETKNTENEPVTPECSINPPTVSEGDSEVPPFPIGFTPLSESAVKGVERFVYFIGYGRSGHSIIASMLDAHPNIIIAHEYSIFENLRTMGRNAFSKEFIFNQLYRNSYESAICRDGWRNIAMNKKRYTLDMPGLWQGRFKELKVVGDKAAGYTAMEYYNSPGDFTELYSEFLATIGIPVQVIHVVRNPYDIIANVVLYMHSGPKYGVKLNASANNKFFHYGSLPAAINITFTKAEAVVKMKQALNLNVLDIYTEDFVVDPEATMRKLCSALGVECSERYLKKCKDKAFKELPMTRDFVLWPKRELNLVKEKCQEFPFFKRYDFSEEKKQ